MPTTSAIGDAAARTVDQQFVDLICNDQELLAAEFDAIIAAEWYKPPINRPRGAAWPPVSRAPRHRAARVGGPVARPQHPGIGGWARQRSPPARQP